MGKTDDTQKTVELALSTHLKGLLADIDAAEKKLADIQNLPLAIAECKKWEDELRVQAEQLTAIDKEQMDRSAALTEREAKIETAKAALLASQKSAA